jgi:DNA invertase Pin-like site-specific DNA recombinase
MRVIGYTRVSTGQQAAQGTSEPDQLKGIRAWCKANGHKLVTHCGDSGISGGKDESERAGLAEALAMIERHEADAIVTKDLSRFARSLTIQEMTLGIIWRAGAKLFVYENGPTTSGEVLADDPDDPVRTLIRQVLGAVYEFDRASIAKRLREGRRAKAVRGGYAYGSPAYGYQADDKELVTDETEQRGIARIGELHAAGKSFREIAATLTAEGIPAKRGGAWHPMTVKRIVERN